MKAVNEIIIKEKVCNTCYYKLYSNFKSRN